MEMNAPAFNNHQTGSVPTTTIPLSQMLRPQIVGGKVSVPVSDFTVYTRFKHISVSPAAGDSVGYSSSRLRILDTLIDRLIQMKERSIQREDEHNVSGMSSEAIDAMIQQYARKYQNLSNSGMNSIVQQKGVDFGVEESGTAMFLDLTA